MPNTPVPADAAGLPARKRHRKRGSSISVGELVEFFQLWDGLTPEYRLLATQWLEWSANDGRDETEPEFWPGSRRIDGRKPRPTDHAKGGDA